MRKYLAVAFFVPFAAQAQLHRIPTVNLDKPGALAALEREKPEHYRTVVNTVRAAERMHCGVDWKALQVGDRNPCRSHLIRTSYPAQVFLSIPFDDAVYGVTAYLDTSLDRLSRAK
jgi:hypothetical protein